MNILKMKNTSAFLIFFAFALIFPKNIRAQVPLAGSYIPCEEMPLLLDTYAADHRSLSIYYSVQTAPETLARFNQLSEEYLQRLEQLDFDALPQECKVDYILFKRNLEERIRENQVMTRETEKLNSYFPFAEKVYAFAKTRRQGGEIDAKALALEMEAMTKNIVELDKQLEADDQLELTSIYMAKTLLSDMRKALGNSFEFYNGYDPLFTWWVPVPYKNLDSTLNAYASSFEEKLLSPGFLMDNSGIVGKPIGREALLRDLAFNMIPYTPEELIEIAEKELAWSDREMLKASREMGYGDDWKAASEAVKETYVEAGDQPKVIKRLYDESMAFIKEHDLVTIPPLVEEVWGIRMMTPEQQLVSPFFLGGTSIWVSYPTNTMEISDRMMSMRGNNPHFSRATVHHEAIPGHHFQGFMNNRNRSYRQFHTPFWMEGNALYWEFLLYDMDFPQGPEDRVGMLFWRMHRSARVIFSLNFHLGNWTPQQCIDFLVDRVNFERANAEAEVRRSFTTNYSPLYQLAYMMGGLQFRALKQEVVDNGPLSLKEYHDAIVSLNSMPIEMLRAILTEQPLKKEYISQWKFYDESQMPEQ